MNEVNLNGLYYPAHVSWDLGWKGTGEAGSRGWVGRAPVKPGRGVYFDKKAQILRKKFK